MSCQQTYIVRLLRQVESFTPNHGTRSAGNPLGAIIQKISQADNVHQALEMLYAVQGFEDFAVRLMWCLERNGVVYADPANDVVDYEVRHLNAVLNHSSNGRAVHSTALDIASQPLIDFYDTLHNVSRSVEEVRRKFLQAEEAKDVDSEALYRLMSDIEDLKKAAKKAGNEQACRFADSASIFLHHVVDHDRSHDRRIVHILDHANRTLQTVMGAVGLEEFQSLDEVAVMLSSPEELLA